MREKIQLEVARRLDAILNTPDVVERYDRNGDGVLDAEERDLLRYVVEAEVVRELEGLPTTDGPEDPAEPRLRPVEAWRFDDGLDELPIIEVVDERYELLAQLGAGSQGSTYLARDRETGVHVAVKEMAFARVSSWKSLELFEREARILRQLDHPAIPRFIDSFRLDEADDLPRYFLVQEFVRGEGLDVVIARGDRMTSRDIARFARHILGVLDYLHTLSPPVVHRDVKPSNIVRHDGEYRLVDFGAVQLVAPNDTGGSTVVGTSGFMPAEQLSGRACPQSDLYALGATLVYLATHVHPSKLPQSRLKLDWRDRATGLPTPLAEFIDRLVEPVVEDRFPTARSAIAALDALEGALPVAARPAKSIEAQRPPDADARLLWDGDALIVEMSQSMLAPRLICGTLGAGVGIFLSFMMLAWFYLPLSLLGGLLLAEAWSSGPQERLQVMPGGRFHHLFYDGKTRRESSGAVHRFRLDGSQVILQTDTGATLNVGSHCNPQTRRWIFGTVDHFLRSG